MTVPEYQLWLLYRQKYGGLNPMMRTEWGAALVSSVIANVNRGPNSQPFTVTDFSPHLASNSEKEELTLEEAKKLWQ
ncbi:phage tail protein [Rosenbergiella epipactidis]|uniref:phage tail assembly protein T n=1 Tax=Rosenbergiella epipactidis TaxID=1544694 RepID=UPI001BD925B7|nr:phage tail protein [Rosenbergiella epipactidis]MBT0718147.1 phage tail protein [Rosenbergiella epipactidis]